MFKGSRKYWVIAVACGLAVSILVYNYLEQVKNSYRPGNLVQVVVAENDIAKGTVITREMIGINEYPENYIHPDAIRDIQQVIGKVAVQTIMSDEQVLYTRLLDSVKASRLAYSIPDTKRAVSIAVDEVSGLAGQIKIGDRVDIIATLDISVPAAQGERNQSYSLITVQNVEVLAVGNNNNTESAGKSYETITLAVNLEEARRLVLASERGKVRLLLRAPGDNSWTDLPPFELQDFLR